MIDRYHSAASPFSGDTLLSRYYSSVPLLSEAWGVGAIGLPFASGRRFQILGFPLPLPVDTTFIASIRYLGAIHLQLEEIASSQDAAKNSVGMANLVLGMLRTAQVTSGSQDASAQDWSTLLQSTKVEQKGNHAILRAVVPISLVRDLMTQKSATVPATPGNNPSSPSQ